ncbi:hypothetical protein M0802_007260 [Mischocyttarus mexicanus]|nr:hypothetical protein M0802_007260 [Mischocyttarus mexicanus]
MRSSLYAVRRPCPSIYVCGNKIVIVTIIINRRQVHFTFPKTQVNLVLLSGDLTFAIGQPTSNNPLNIFEIGQRCFNITLKIEREYKIRLNEQSNKDCLILDQTCSCGGGGGGGGGGGDVADVCGGRW